MNSMQFTLHNINVFLCNIIGLFLKQLLTPQLPLYCHLHQNFEKSGISYASSVKGYSKEVSLLYFVVENEIKVKQNISG